MWSRAAAVAIRGLAAITVSRAGGMLRVRGVASKV
jgi:hypothetical protein